MGASTLVVVSVLSVLCVCAGYSLGRYERRAATDMQHVKDVLVRAAEVQQARTVSVMRWVPDTMSVDDLARVRVSNILPSMPAWPVGSITEMKILVGPTSAEPQIWLRNIDGHTATMWLQRVEDKGWFVGSIDDPWSNDRWKNVLSTPH